MANVLIPSEWSLSSASILLADGGAPGSKIFLIFSYAVVIVKPTSASFDFFIISMSLRTRGDGLDRERPAVVDENLKASPCDQVLLFKWLVWIAHAAYPYFAHVLFFHFSLQKLRRIYFDIYKLPPRFLVASESLHEFCIAIYAGMLAAHIGIHRVIIDLELGKDVFCFYFPDIHSLNHSTRGADIF